MVDFLIEPDGKHRAWPFYMLRFAMVNFHTINLGPLRLDAVNNIADILQRGKLYIKIHIPRILHRNPLQNRQESHAQKNQDKCNDNTLIKSGTNRQSHTG